MFEAFGMARSWSGNWYWQPLGGKHTQKHVWLSWALLWVFDMCGMYWSIRVYAWLWKVWTTGVIPF